MNAKQTLQQIAEKLWCTRERVRQLEKSAQSKRFLIAPLLSVLIKEIVCRKGDLVYDDANRTPIISFIAKCLGIPYVSLPGIGIVVLGISIQNLKKKTFISKEPDKDNANRILKHEFEGALSQSSRDVVKAFLIKEKGFRVSLIQRLYVTLKSLGRPAHYSIIMNTYDSLFPYQPCSEATILNALGRERHALEREALGIVWIGVKGMYALREWGYERPTKTLQNTVKEIVQARYEATQKPVPFEVIVAEIGKYRKFVKHSSIHSAINANPNVERVSDRLFLPKRSKRESGKRDSEYKLDRILQEFERTGVDREYTGPVKE